MKSKIPNRKKAIFSLFPAFFLLILIYIILSVSYYYTRMHPFDPFLQMHPPHLDSKYFKKPDNVFRILTMGGSTTGNIRLDQEKRYPEVLRSIIQKHYQSTGIEVFNAGMDWYTTKHSLINYVTNMRDFHPDMVVIMHAINDLYRSFSAPDLAIGPYNRLWSHYYGPSINGARPPTFERFIFLKFFYSWYSDFVSQERNVPLDRYLSIKDFERNLKRIVHFVKSDNVPILLMTQPSLYKTNMNYEELSVLWLGKRFCNAKINLFQREYPSPASLRIAMQAFNDIIRKTAKSEQVILIDLDRIIKKNLKNFVDDVHYTEEGARKVAEAVGNEIIKNTTPN